MGGAAVQLLCLPYAGASAMIYARWRRLLPSWIDVRPVELPGRGARMDDPLSVDPHRLADRLAGELALGLEGPYALFGHSLGALLVFELAHALADLGRPPPIVLFASGTEAPSMRDDARWRQPLADDALVAELRGLRGTSEEVLADPEIMRFTLPILRADFLMCGAYAYRRRPPLACPIRVLGGIDDDTSRPALDGWGQETAAGFDVDMFKGDHFFLHTSQAEVLSLVQADLSHRMRSPRPDLTAA